MSPGTVVLYRRNYVDEATRHRQRNVQAGWGANSSFLSD